MSFLTKIKKFFKTLIASIGRPIYRNAKNRCPSLHEWTSIDKLLEEPDQNRLQKFIGSEKIEPLSSLCQGTPICRNCGYVANHDVNLNIENLVLYLRAFDT